MTPPRTSAIRPEPDELAVGTRKLVAASRAAAYKRTRRSRRRQVWACFWTRPLGHRYAGPNGQTPGEVFAASNPGGAKIPLHCVGCGREFGLFTSYD